MEKDLVAQMQDFFFEGAKAGWAGGHDGVYLHLNEGTPEMRKNWRKTEFRSDAFPNFYLIDRWGRDPNSGLVSGSMQIIHNHIPVWAMWYGLQTYPKEALPFLREALMASYNSKKFHGGRGPSFYQREGLVYVNNCKGNFLDFHGREYITDPKKQEVIGEHTFKGMSLLYLLPIPQSGRP